MPATVWQRIFKDRANMDDGDSGIPELPIASLLRRYAADDYKTHAQVLNRIFDGRNDPSIDPESEMAGRGHPLTATERTQFTVVLVAIDASGPVKSEARRRYTEKLSDALILRAHKSIDTEEAKLALEV